MITIIVYGVGGSPPDIGVKLGDLERALKTAVVAIKSFAAKPDEVAIFFPKECAGGSSLPANEIVVMISEIGNIRSHRYAEINQLVATCGQLIQKHFLDSHVTAVINFSVDQSSWAAARPKRLGT